MKPLRDPEGSELAHLVAASDLAGKRILEIGCGSGVFTWQYAGYPDQTVGIDPAVAELHKAVIDRPAPKSKLSFIQALGGAIPIMSDTFDVALFASSL